MFFISFFFNDKVSGRKLKLILCIGLKIIRNNSLNLRVEEVGQSVNWFCTGTVLVLESFNLFLESRKKNDNFFSFFGGVSTWGTFGTPKSLKTSAGP